MAKQVDKCVGPEKPINGGSFFPSGQDFKNPAMNENPDRDDDRGQDDNTPGLVSFQKGFLLDGQKFDQYP